MDDNLELRLTRYIAAPPERVWDVLVNRQEEWFCPKPWRAKISHQDRRAGGRCEMTFHGPDGEVMPQNGIYLAFDGGAASSPPMPWSTGPMAISSRQGRS